MKTTLAIAPVLALLAACGADHQPASDDNADVDAVAHHGGAAVDDSPSTRAFMAANDKMHRDMAVGYTGNADADFVAAMIPHHEGALAMARVALEHGKDPEIRKLAEAEIVSQEGEIADMRAWEKRLAAQAH